MAVQVGGGSKYILSRIATIDVELKGVFPVFSIELAQCLAVLVDLLVIRLEVISAAHHKQQAPALNSNFPYNILPTLSYDFLHG